LERATGIEPVLPAWESNLSGLYFQHLQNRSAKTYVHALHIVHALPDLRIAAGRLRDVCGTVSRANLTFLEPASSDHSEQILMGCQRWRATAKSRKLKAVSQVTARTS
jgi:hypothetical protein